ncbi:MAG: 4Fe-4S dicluster domain-containing protein [Bacteroidota bacterium]
MEEIQKPARHEEEELYRDSLSTVDESGKRIWLHPKAPEGKLHRARVVVSVVLLALLFGAPFVQVKGQPFFLFNVFERRFILFGQDFFPQDFFLLGLATLTFFVFIILFTVVYGRVWCGWACPQTLFMEMIFRKIEYWIEGDAHQQRALDKALWDARKIAKKSAKHVLFLLFSVIIAHTVMAYLIGVAQVRETITHSPADNWAGFTGLVVFTGIFYFVFAKLREQVCTVVCPYGRLQSVLLNRDSMIVAYDFIRGEPRGKLTKEKKPSTGCSGSCAGCTSKLHADRLGTVGDIQQSAATALKLEDLIPKGDCIDCKLCVQVCPTGIDIRNGLQLECINCTACMDACDQVMEKIGKPKGLIRIDSQKGIEEKKSFRFTARMMAYSAVLVGLLALQGFLLTGRSSVEATVLRVPGLMYQRQPNGLISNLYNAQLLNKSSEDMTVTLKLHQAKGYPGGTIRVIGEKINLPKRKATEVVFFVDIPASQLIKAKTPLLIEVYAEGQLLETTKTNFLGPSKSL